MGKRMKIVSQNFLLVKIVSQNRICAGVKTCCYLTAITTRFILLYKVYEY